MNYKPKIDGLSQRVKSMEPTETGPLDLSLKERDDRIFELSAEFVAGLPEEERTRFNDKVNSIKEGQND